MPNDTHALPSPLNAALLLADGKVFFGTGAGVTGTVLGEICFNTAMTGYQEVLTDPSYNGQVVTFTFPHIGNVGCNAEDIESGDGQGKTRHLGACGAVFRESITAQSNFRAEGRLDAWLAAKGITAICGVDTRALTRLIRANGACNVAIVHSAGGAVSREELESVAKALASYPSLAGMELAKKVMSSEPYAWKQRRWVLGKGYAPGAAAGFHVVAVDYGEKLNILRCLADRDCKVTVVPGDAAAETILALKPDGVFLSNGPGDPAATGEYAVPVIRALIAKGMPVFGICLGHQMLALALGGSTEKMRQGHRGANHPVKNLVTGAVEITSQNHGFVVREDSLPEGVEVTHRSLFDGSVEGIRLKGRSVFSVQYHPESSPGPHDSMYLFEEFVNMMGGNHA